MFPWADTVARRYPPIVVWSVIGISALAFLYQVGLPPRVLNRFLFDFALVPSRVFGQLRHIAPSDWTPFLTNIFLHAGWLHLILNMWTGIVKLTSAKQKRDARHVHCSCASDLRP